MCRLAVLLLLPTIAVPALRSQTVTTWHTDLAAARKLAATRHAPLLLVFRCER